MSLGDIKISAVSGAQKEALTGSFGTPAEGNRFVTELDPKILIFTTSLRAFLALQ